MIARRHDHRATGAGFGAGLAAIVAFSCVAVAAGADDFEATRRIGPHRLPPATSGVTIDGVIDEQAWTDALVLELRYEISPGENVSPPVRTVAYLTASDTHVLVAFRAWDPEPEKIRARLRDRDQIWGDDAVGITLDTFNDERRAYEFWVNPLGVQLDAVLNDVLGGGGGRGFDRAWDAIWESAGRLTDFGFEVEMAIPFNQIRFQSVDGPQTWGLDLTRSWPRSDQVRIGLFPRERGNNSYLSQTDKVTGMAGATAGRNLELVPTITGRVAEERPDFPDSTVLEKSEDIEIGATVRWGVSPNITLTGAVNPDFSQIEADAVQLGINQRFALFYQEKRPFFLESSDYFDTGLDLLYTRMVADPSAALKFTGKLGRHTFGVFSARDEVTNLVVPGVEGSESGDFESANTATVARYRFDLGADSTVGAMITDREGEGGYFNRVFSLDSRFRPTESDSLTIDASWSSTRYSPEMEQEIDLPEDEISDHALSVGYQHTKRDWFAFAEYRDFGDGFRADLGFIPRVGYREGDVGAGYIWWGDGDNWYNRLEVGGFLARTEDQAGELLSDVATVWTEGEGPLQTGFHLELNRQTEVYEGVRFDGLLVPSLNVRMRPSSAVRLHLRGIFGDWIDFSNVQSADRVSIELEVGLNLGRHLQVDLDFLHSSLDVSGGRLFTARVPQLTGIWQFNTRTLVRAIVQYTDIQRDPALYVDEVDAVERDSFVQLLFSYKVNPQTVAFVGYSEGREQYDGVPMTTTGRAVFVKLGYAWLW